MVDVVVCDQNAFYSRYAGANLFKGSPYPSGADSCINQHAPGTAANKVAIAATATGKAT